MTLSSTMQPPNLIILPVDPSIMRFNVAVMRASRNMARGSDDRTPRFSSNMALAMGALVIKGAVSLMPRTLK
jgi:hypothetical protein